MTAPNPATETNAPHVSFNLLASYGVGQSATGAMTMAMSFFLIFYYNQVLGLSGTLAGTAVGFAVIVDAFSDPLMGSLSDNWRSRLGRRHPFMYAAIIPVAISFFFLFNPLVTSETGLFIWLMIFANATRTSMSLFNIPHMALGAEVTEDYDQRSALVAHRYFFDRVGNLLSLSIGLGFFFRATQEFENGQLNANAYPPFGFVVAIIMAAVIFWAAWGTRSIIPHLPKLPEAHPIGFARILLRVATDLVSSLRSRSFRWLFGGMMNIYAVSGAHYALDLYMFGYFWEIGTHETLFVMIAYPIGGMIGSFFGPALTARFGKRAALILGTLGIPVWQTLPIALRLFDAFPENGHELLVPLLVAFKGIQGVFVIQADVAFGAMVADIVDEHEVETKKRQEGIFFAGTFFAGKATAGLGAIIAGVALDLISWPRGDHIKTAADVPAETILELGLIYGPLFAIFGLASVWCFSHYKLTRERHREVLAILAERRAATKGTGP